MYNFLINWSSSTCQCTGHKNTASSIPSSEPLLLLFCLINKYHFSFLARTATRKGAAAPWSKPLEPAAWQHLQGDPSPTEVLHHALVQLFHENRSENSLHFHVLDTNYWNGNISSNLKKKNLKVRWRLSPFRLHTSMDSLTTIPSLRGMHSKSQSPLERENWFNKFPLPPSLYLTQGCRHMG